jgi:hypothetical protein
MISDVLFSAVEQIRAHMREGDAYVFAERERGIDVRSDDEAIAHINDVLAQMERLARRLVTDTIGPYVNERQ